MLCLCASPQLIPHALCLLDVASGTIVRTTSVPKYAYSNTSMPPIDPPTTAAICRTPKSSRTSLCMLERVRDGIQRLGLDAYLTSSLTVVRGNSGPYRSRLGSPSTLVTGLALPYGLPKLFKQTMKNLVISKARPEPPINGPHQSATSALPDRAWHITRALSPLAESFPRVV